MRRVIGYSRVSSREQAVNGQALEQQNSRLREAGATEIYQDIQSGTCDNRPALKQVMELVKTKQVDEVIITRIDRKARSLKKLTECINLYIEADVNLRILDQQIDLRTSQGKLMSNILGALAEWEVDLLSERVRHGKQYARSQKKACDSYPWGYKVINGKYQLDETSFLCLLEDRPIHYLDLYAEKDLTKLPGLTVKETARDCIDIFFEMKGISRGLKAIFKKYGVKKRKGRTSGASGIFHWTTTGFNQWLTNPVLRGHTVYFKKKKTASGTRRLNKPENWQVVPNTHPEYQLLSDEEAEEIQQIIKFNSRIGCGNFNHDLNQESCYREYTYQSGLVFCAECHSRCISKSAKNRQGGHYYYWACRYANMGCENLKSVRKEKIEEILIQTLVKTALNLAEDPHHPPSVNLEKSETLKQLESRLEALDRIPGFDPDLENLKEKTRQLIAEEINPFLSDVIYQKTVEEIIRAGNNLAIWHTLTNDDKVKIYPQIVQRITIRGGQLESIVLKLSH